MGHCRFDYFCMKAPVRALHCLGVLAALAICFFEAVQAARFYGNEYRSLTFGRSIPSVLMGSYALVHLCLLGFQRLTSQALLWFYPLSIAIGLIGAFVSEGHGKTWAPADAAEAFQASATGFGTLGMLCLGAAFSCYRSFSAGGKLRA